MNSLLRGAIIVLVLSVVAFAWGYTYTQQNRSKAWGSMFGYRDATYEAAGYATIAGVAGFLIGIGLLIGGVARQKDRPSDHSIPKNKPYVRSTPQQYCQNCGTHVSSEAEYCGNCGMKVT